MNHYIRTIPRTHSQSYTASAARYSAVVSLFKRALISAPQSATQVGEREEDEDTIRRKYRRKRRHKSY
jgi:hypothetical protein